MHFYFLASILLSEIENWKFASFQGWLISLGSVLEFILNRLSANLGFLFVNKISKSFKVAWSKQWIKSARVFVTKCLLGQWLLNSIRTTHQDLLSGILVFFYKDLILSYQTPQELETGPEKWNWPVNLHNSLGLMEAKDSSGRYMQPCYPVWKHNLVFCIFQWTHTFL